jgi:hypothetical protein
MALPISLSIHGAIAYREEQHFKMFIALLRTDSKFVHSAIANTCTYIEDKKPLYRSVSK